MTAHEKLDRLYNPGMDSFMLDPDFNESFASSPIVIPSSNLPIDMELSDINDPVDTLMPIRWTGWLSPYYTDGFPYQI